MTQGKKPDHEELWEQQHPRCAKWTDEALPLPIRRRLLLDELSNVRAAKERPEERGAERPE